MISWPSQTLPSPVLPLLHFLPLPPPPQHFIPPLLPLPQHFIPPLPPPPPPPPPPPLPPPPPPPPPDITQHYGATALLHTEFPPNKLFYKFHISESPIWLNKDVKENPEIFNRYQYASVERSVDVFKCSLKNLLFEKHWDAVVTAKEAIHIKTKFEEAGVFRIVQCIMEQLQWKDTTVGHIMTMVYVIHLILLIEKNNPYYLRKHAGSRIFCFGFSAGKFYLTYSQLIKTAPNEKVRLELATLISWFKASPLTDFFRDMTPQCYFNIQPEDSKVKRARLKKEAKGRKRMEKLMNKTIYEPSNMYNKNKNTKKKKQCEQNSRPTPIQNSRINRIISSMMSPDKAASVLPTGIGNRNTITTLNNNSAKNIGKDFNAREMKNVVETIFCNNNKLKEAVKDPHIFSTVKNENVPNLNNSENTQAQTIASQRLNQSCKTQKDSNKVTSQKKSINIITEHRKAPNGLRDEHESPKLKQNKILKHKDNLKSKLIEAVKNNGDGAFKNTSLSVVTNSDSKTFVGKALTLPTLNRTCLGSKRNSSSNDSPNQKKPYLSFRETMYAAMRNVSNSSITPKISKNKEGNNQTTKISTKVKNKLGKSSSSKFSNTVSSINKNTDESCPPKETKKNKALKKDVSKRKVGKADPPGNRKLKEPIKEQAQASPPQCDMYYDPLSSDSDDIVEICSSTIGIDIPRNAKSSGSSSSSKLNSKKKVVKNKKLKSKTPSSLDSRTQPQMTEKNMKLGEIKTEVSDFPESPAVLSSKTNMSSEVKTEVSDFPGSPAVLSSKTNASSQVKTEVSDFLISLSKKKLGKTDLPGNSNLGHAIKKHVQPSPHLLSDMLYDSLSSESEDIVEHNLAAHGTDIPRNAKTKDMSSHSKSNSRKKRTFIKNVKLISKSSLSTELLTQSRMEDKNFKPSEIKTEMSDFPGNKTVSSNKTILSSDIKTEGSDFYGNKAVSSSKQNVVNEIEALESEIVASGNVLSRKPNLSRQIKVRMSDLLGKETVPSSSYKQNILKVLRCKSFFPKDSRVRCTEKDSGKITKQKTKRTARSNTRKHSLNETDTSTCIKSNHSSKIRIPPEECSLSISLPPLPPSEYLVKVFDPPLTEPFDVKEEKIEFKRDSTSNEYKPNLNSLEDSLYANVSLTLPPLPPSEFLNTSAVDAFDDDEDDNVEKKKTALKLLINPDLDKNAWTLSIPGMGLVIVKNFGEGDLCGYLSHPDLVAWEQHESGLELFFYRSGNV